MYKLAKGISPIVMQEIFRIRKRGYNLKSQNTFQIPFTNSVYRGTESISYLGPKSLGAYARYPEKNYLIDQFQRTDKEIEPRKLLM